MKKPPIMHYWKMKPIRIHLMSGMSTEMDTDRDGVFDRNDCRPFDPKRQHLSKRRKEEIDSLRIGVAKGNVVYPSGSKKAKKVLAQQEIYASLNRHPDLIRKIREIDEAWDEKGDRLISEELPSDYPFVVLRVGKKTRKDTLGGSSYGGHVFIDMKPITEDDISKVREYLQRTSEHINEEFDDKVNIKKQDAIAYLLRHELSHEEKSLKSKNPLEERKESFKRRKKEWFDNPSEFEAEQKTLQEMKKRLLPNPQVTGKQLSKILKLD